MCLTLNKIIFMHSYSLCVCVCVCVCVGCVRMRRVCLVSFLHTGGRNSSVGSAWARCPQCRGFDPPMGTFSGRGDFSL